MLEIKITVAAPELSQAINNLAAAISGKQPNTFFTQTESSPVAKVANESAQTSMPENKAVVPAIPAVPVVDNSPIPQIPAANPAVPLAPPPQYTVDQIMAAGATLMDNGKINDLMNLLHSFGVQAVMDLKPEQIGPFATAMRGLGAKI